MFKSLRFVFRRMHYVIFKFYYDCIYSSNHLILGMNTKIKPPFDNFLCPLSKRTPFMRGHKNRRVIFLFVILIR